MKYLRQYIRRILTEETMQPLSDPLFNVREICKEFTLLEDHLNHPDKRCPDCINKHFMKCEALAEEAVSLDKKGQYPFITKMPNVIRGWHTAVLNEKDPENISSQVRRIRKKLTPLVVDRCATKQ